MAHIVMAYIVMAHMWVEGRIEQVFRLWGGSDTLEIEYRVGPIDVSDGIGKEVVSLFETDIESADMFSTDANGMQVNVRQRDQRSTLWPSGPSYFNQTDNVSGNYFAVNTMAHLSDAARSAAPFFLPSRSMPTANRRGPARIQAQHREDLDEAAPLGTFTSAEAPRSSPSACSEMSKKKPRSGGASLFWLTGPRAARRCRAATSSSCFTVDSCMAAAGACAKTVRRPERGFIFSNFSAADGGRRESARIRGTHRKGLGDTHR